MCLGWVANLSLIHPGVCLRNCCYHNKALCCVAPLALWSRLAFNRPWWCVLCQSATRVPAITILSSPAPPSLSSRLPLQHTVRQRSTKLAHPPPTPLHQWPPWTKLLYLQRANHAESEEGERGETERGKVFGGQQIYMPLTSLSSVVCPPSSFRHCLVTI